MRDSLCAAALNRWAIGAELSKKRKRYSKKQKEKKTYEGEDYVPPTQREQELAIPVIDFVHMEIKARPFASKYCCTECGACPIM